MADWYVSSAAWTAIPQFAASTAYVVGNFVRPLTAPAFSAQYAFRCTTAGTSGAEPTWTSAASNNQTVTTGGATFTNVSGQSAYGWSAAAGNLYCLSNGGVGTSRFAAGDRVFISSDSTESSANPTYQLVTASGFGLVQVISVNRAGSVPPVAADQLSGATITGASGNLTLDAATDVYYQGVTFTLGGSTSANIYFNANANKKHYLRNCALNLTNTTGTSAIGVNNCAIVTWDNTTVQFAAVGQRIFAGSYGIDLRWINTPSAIQGATIPTNLFGLSAIGMLASVSGVDLSALNTTLYTNAGSVFSNGAKILLDSCRIASGLVRLGTTYAYPGDEVELVNCYDGTNIISERHTPAGDVTTNRSTTLVGGAQDDVGLFSHQMVSSSRTDGFTMTLDSFWMDLENTLTGSSHTATVEIISSASLNNTDISLVLEYQGTAGSSLVTLSSTLPTALTASSALASSTATWNNMPGTPQRQHLQATFTPQTAGRVRGLVRLGKPSTTVWINPQIMVT